ncbi:MAG: TlyA family RNA methyltransferase [Terriglobales bacterium]
MPHPPAKVRLDLLVAERGLADSRQQAQALILAGRILVAGQKAAKPGHPTAPDAALERLGPAARFASRAGGKLEAALDHFQVAVAGRIALDVGSSTGGFTDCLLARGALRVHAVDSGTNQMVWRLRTDSRVHVLENTNARHLRLEQLVGAGPSACATETLAPACAPQGERPDLLTMDVSFISATLLLPQVGPLLAPAAEAIVLVKPQFEAGRAAVGSGGIVRDPATQRAAVERVANCLRALGAAVAPALPSPVLGATGNQEFLLYARWPGGTASC